MSDEQNTPDEGKQSVGDEAGAAKATDDAAAQGKADDTLDADLNEFGDSGQAAASDQDGEGEDGISADELKEIRADAAQARQYRYEQDLKNTIVDVRGDLKVDDKIVKGWLFAEADDDPRIGAAFANRSRNPGAFKRVVSGLRSKFAKEMKAQATRDDDASKDRDAVANAVRGASTSKAPEKAAPDYAKMSDAEFAATVEEDYGFRPL